MERFYQRIETKAADVTQPPILIVAFGDSITQGVMEHKRMAPESVYHRHLQLRLQETYPLTTFSTINAGVSGTTATQAMTRLERDVSSHHPDLVLVAFGANDCLGGEAGKTDFREVLTSIIRQIRRETEADIVMLTPPMMAEHHTDRIHPDHHEIAYIIIKAQTSGDLSFYANIVRSVAKQEQIPLADVHQAWLNLAAQGVDTTAWLSNGLNHPDERGQALAADVLWACLDTHCPSQFKNSPSLYENHRPSLRYPSSRPL